MALYQQWTRALNLPDPIRRILQTMPYLSIDQRKAVLACTRCQIPVIMGSTLERQLGHILDTVPLIPIGLDGLEFSHIDFRIFINSVTDSIINKPIICSLISLVTRIAPYDDESWIPDYILSLTEKEVAAAIELYHPETFDYSAIMTYNRSDIIFSSRLPHDQDICKSIYLCLARARSTLSGMTLWPDFGTKLVGLEAEKHFWEIYNASGLEFMSDKEYTGVSTADTIRLYVETGEKARGPVEMRSSWRYNDLKPRVYYARGGDTLFASLYIQNIFNTLVDAFPECHRFNRFQEPEDHILGPDDVSLIYDYSSFTSTLHEIVNFIDALAEFMDGTFLTVIDPVEGPKQMSVGELLKEYNRICNDHPEFDTSRVLGSEYGILHHLCGMLGIPGNIFSCTLLHAIMLRIIAGLKRSRTVGDDGKIYTKNGLTPEGERYISDLFYQLESIGRLNLSKMSVFPYQDLDFDDLSAFAYQFVKRPYYRIDTRMQIGELLLLPNCAFIQKFADRFHQCIDGGYTDAIRLYGKQLSRFVNHLADEVLYLSSDDLHVLRRLVSVNHSMAVRTLETLEGWEGKDRAIKQFANRYMYINVPDDWSLWSFANVVLSKYELDEPICISVPYQAIEDFEVSWDVGETFEYRSTKMLSYLQKLDYVESEKVRTTITREEYGDDLCRDLILETTAPLYTFKVCRPVPKWIISMPLDK